MLSNSEESAGGTPIKKLNQALLILLIAGMIVPALNINPQPVHAAETQTGWTTTSPMPDPRGGLGLAVVNGKIYAIGGLNGNNVPVSVTQEYNPQTNEWVSKTPMPTPRSGFAIAVYLNKIYVIGGTVGNGYVGNNEVFDPVHNSWETKTSMPTPRADLSANVVGDKIYLIGGKKYSNTSPFFDQTDINEVYDPANDSWSTRTSIPIPVQGYASAVVNDKIYFVGGTKESSLQDNTVTTDANQVYDPQKDSWGSAAKLPQVTSYAAAAATQGDMAPAMLYCVGGYSAGEFSKKSYVYNPANGSWNAIAEMPTARAYLGVAVVNDVLYAIGGFDGTNSLGENEQYTPIGYGKVAPKLQITSPENKTYSEVTVAFTTNRGTAWIGYSLDGKGNITITGETKLANLTQGTHAITIFANDSFGNMGSSSTAYFSVDTLPPAIKLILPENRSYDATDIQVVFSINENASRITYSLDGQKNDEIAGNFTLPALSTGSHRLTVTATDANGNSAQQTVYFNIAPFPVVPVAAVVAMATIIVAGGFLYVKRRKTVTEKDETKESA